MFTLDFYGVSVSILRPPADEEMVLTNSIKKTQKSAHLKYRHSTRTCILSHAGSSGRGRCQMKIKIEKKNQKNSCTAQPGSHYDGRGRSAHRESYARAAYGSSSSAWRGAFAPFA